MPNPEKIVILTGAGISAESGLGTFRDKGGIWSEHRIEDVATPKAFARDPARVHASRPPMPPPTPLTPRWRACRRITPARW